MLKSLGCRTACAALALAGCGGGSTGVSPAPADAAPAIAGVEVQPTYHRAPMALAEPGTADADGSQTSAALPPRATEVPAELADLDTARLTDADVQAHLRARSASGVRAQAGAAPKVVYTYTPAQIRSAYGLPPLPMPGAAPTRAQAAGLGSGQTIYLIDSYSYPNVASDLAIFNRTFGLPACATVAIPVTAKLPLAPAAAGTSCTLSIVYASRSGAMAAAAPAYDAGWAGEIALDVQWAHATAPMARIILVEAQDNSVSSDYGAIALANRMGPGVVSMSFGAPEWRGQTAYDGLFAAPGMSYFASTGDRGAGVAWPSASAAVMAVGGTSLTYTGGTRSEVVWTGTGGGLSSQEPAPAYQAKSGVSIPGEPGRPAAARPALPWMRAVADLAFNADPYTGQFVVLSQPSVANGSPLFYDYGGTSISAPQWAGIAAIANAQRALVSKATLGDFHAGLYSRLGLVAGIYATAFADITQGSDGACNACRAFAGYDLPTGWGTPNVDNLLPHLVAF
jgi:subtilase family serine protease